LTYFPGDNHVFRFNNPEEVRKQRDRATAKSNLYLSVSASDLDSAGDGHGSPTTRPDSPVSSTDQADVDWTFAKREAAYARLGLDPTLDNLPDDDLNKLFEKITKVKTLRDHNSKSRPESSLSQADDIWSEPGRPFSSDATDDTSMEAFGSPDIDGSLKDVQNQLETRLLAITELTEAEDLKVEKDHMEHQLNRVRMQMKRLIEARARGETETGLMEFEPVIYSAKQIRLIHKVLDRWKSRRSFSMAEITLSSAVLVKEANVIRWVPSMRLCNLSENKIARSLGKTYRTTSQSHLEDRYPPLLRPLTPLLAWTSLVMLQIPFLYQQPSLPWQSRFSTNATMQSTHGPWIGCNSSCNECAI